MKVPSPKFSRANGAVRRPKAPRNGVFWYWLATKFIIRIALVALMRAIRFSPLAAATAGREWRVVSSDSGHKAAKIWESEPNIATILCKIHLRTSLPMRRFGNRSALDLFVLAYVSYVFAPILERKRRPSRRSDSKSKTGRGWTGLARSLFFTFSARRLTI